MKSIKSSKLWINFLTNLLFYLLPEELIFISYFFMPKQNGYALDDWFVTAWDSYKVARAVTEGAVSRATYNVKE